MSSIHFFTPVIYNNPTKTRAQQALEAIDECFYLGNKLRVTIFTSNATHPQSWALQNRQCYYRSWKNIAIKVAFFFTLLPPLILLTAKALLRRHLKVSSIKIEQGFAPNSIEAKLPVYVLQKIGSFLNYRDQDQLARVAHFTHDAARRTQQLTALLKTEVEALPVYGAFFCDDFQRLLVQLVKSPAAGHSKHWVSVMNALIRHIPIHSKTKGSIESHGEIASLLAYSEQPISPDQIYQFCKYLGNDRSGYVERCNQLLKWSPWIGYRALEQYLHYPEKLDLTAINRSLKEYLTQQAKVLIVARNDLYYPLNNHLKLLVHKIEIDPRQWFGRDGNEYSLWFKRPWRSDGEIAPMPDLLVEVLWTHIQSLRASCMDRPFIVSMMGSTTATLPYNFTLKLAQLITSAGIFLEHGNSIDGGQLEKSRYALPHLDREWMAAEYPQAVENL